MRRYKSPSNSIPLYAQIEDTLTREIIERYRPGDPLPTQQDLADRFNTSLTTVKRALYELAHKGIVDCIRGRAAIVKIQVPDSHTGVSSWTESMIGIGAVPETAWVRFEPDEAGAEERRRLGLGDSKPILTIRRLRTLNGDPYCVMENHIPAARVPDLPTRGLQSESLYEVLEQRYGFQIAYADEMVRAREATVEESVLLGESVRTVVVVDRTSYDAANHPIELSRLVAPAERYTYRVRVQRSTDVGRTGDQSE